MSRAGSFNRECTVQKKYEPVEQDATYGTEIPEWVPLVPLAGSPLIGERFACRVRGLAPSRSEAVSQGLMIGRDQIAIGMRYRNDITSAMRIILHGDTDVVYQIIGGPSEVEGGRKGDIEIVCERYTS